MTCKFIKKGNIFESTCEAWVNPVNCIGVMGSGLALAFKIKFPDMFKEYKKICDEQKLFPGLVHIYCSENPKYIINFPTQDDLSPSRIVYISSGLVNLAYEVKHLDIKSIALCALGCGLGGLKWENVKPLIECFAESLPDTMVEVYEPLEDD